MSPTPIRCDTCDQNFDSLNEKLQHKNSRQHRDKLLEKTGKEMPSGPVNVKPDLVTEEDKLKAEAFLRNFKEDYFVCPVGKDLGDFLRENNIKLTAEKEEEVTPA